MTRAALLENHAMNPKVIVISMKIVCLDWDVDTTKISAELKMEEDGKSEMIAVINQVSERYTVHNYS